MEATPIQLMEQHVESTDWNGFQFKRATIEDVDVITDLVRNQYFPDEPISKLQGVSKEHEDDFKQIWSSFLDDHLTFIAIHRESGKPAGVRISFEHDKDKDWTVYDLKAPETTRLLTCVKLLDEQSNLFEKHNVTKYADLLLTCVHTDFRKRGLVGEMYRRSIALARSRGYKLAKACFSSPFSRKAAANQGFTEVARLPLAGLQDDNHIEIFPTATDEMVTQSIYIL